MQKNKAASGGPAVSGKRKGPLVSALRAEADLPHGPASFRAAGEMTGPCELFSRP